MEDERNSVADFLNEMTDTPEIFKEEAEVPEDEEETIEDEKPLPFHRDPKVQRYVEKEVQRALKDKIPTAEQTFRKDVEEINLPDSFVQLIGNDTPEKVQVLKDMSKYFSTLKGDAKQEFLSEMQQQEQARTDADTKAQEELDTYFDEIEETYSVDLTSNSAQAKQMRSQFIDYVRKIAPKDENGEVAAFPDLVASFEEFQERNKRAPASRAKALANRGLTRSSDTDTSIPQGKSWKDVDRYFEKLKGSN